MFNRVLNMPLSLPIFLFFQRPPSWCWRTVCITVWHHLNMATVSQGMKALPVNHSEQLSDSISTRDVSTGHYLLLLFLLVVLLFACLFYFSFLLFVCLFVCVFLPIKHFFYFSFFSDSNMISISTVGFRHYVVIIVLVNVGEPWVIRD